MPTQPEQSTPHRVTGGELTLEEHLASLDTLRALEADVDALKSGRAALEAEAIAAEVSARRPAVPSPAAEPASRPPVETAYRLSANLERKRALEIRLYGQPLRQEQHSAEQIGRARDALRAWLDAPGEPEPQRAQRIAKAVLLVLTAIVAWLSWTVHGAFAILIVPIVVPMTLLFRKGENAAWRRAGAKQAFERIRIPGPSEWTETAVEARLAGLETSLLAIERQLQDSGPRASLSEAEELECSLELVTVTQSLEADLRKLGLSLDAVSPHDEDRWRELAAGYSAQRSLESIESERREKEREADVIRERVFRFLSRAGAAPAGARADTDSLEGALRRLQAERDTDHETTGG